MTRTASRFPKSLLTTAMTASLMLSACGGGGSDSGSATSISLSGSIGDGYLVAQKPGLLDRLAGLLGLGSLQAQQALDMVDQVVAIPTNRGNVDAGIYALIEQADIQASGGFELNLDTSYDWVLLLVNSQAQSLDEKVVAYISVPATSGEDIENIPVSQSNGSDMDVGKVQPGSRPRQARTSEGQPMTQLVSLTAQELEDQASYDDSFRHLFNFYLNYDAASGDHYLPLPEARWEAALPLGFQNGQDQESSLGAFSYDGFHASVMTDSTPAVDFDRFCNSSDTLAIHPPAEVTIDGMNFDMGNGMNNATATMEQYSSSYCGHEYLRIEKQADNELMIQFPLGSDEIPAGLWRMKLNGETLAAFDFSLANPFTGNGVPVGFVPQFTLHPDPDNPQRIASISIEWWFRDGSNGWEPVVDDAITDALVRNSFVEFVEYSASVESKSFGQYDNEGLISGNITPDPDHAWYLANKPAELPPNAAEVTDLSIAYEMAGISYRFTWSNGG